MGNRYFCFIKSFTLKPKLGLMGDKGKAKAVPKARRTTERKLLKIEEEISRLEAEIDSFLLRQIILNLNLEASKKGIFD